MNIDTNSPPTDGQVQDLHSQRRSAAVAPASVFHARPINILIVDDEPKNLTVLETVLDAPDYRLVRAESADQALHALVVEEFALLILDIRLPGMNGFELAQMIKQRKKTSGVPIIFLTAYYNEDQHVLEGYGTGAVDYLVKPVNPAILRSKVAVFAELHRKSRALVAEVTERCRVEEELRELNDTLEQRVTERTQALQIASAALHETGERYRSLFDGSLDAIFFLDVDERFKAANPAALRLITRTLEELKTIPFLDLCAPDQREAVRQAFHDVFRRQGFAIDTAVLTVTGERRELFVSGTPTIRDGEVVGISCIARDITERIKTEEALRQNQMLFTAIVDQAPNGMYVVDTQFRIQQVNSRALPVFGSIHPLIGRDFSEVIKILWGPELGGQIVDIFRHTLETGERYFSPPFTERRADLGVEQSYEWETQRVTLPDGKHGVVCYFTDITTRKQAEDALRERDRTLTTVNDALKKQAVALAEANKELEGFSYSVSHDLRAPLRTIDAFSRIVEEEHGPRLNDEGRRSLTIVRKAVGQAGELIDDLLEFSKLGRQGMSFRLVKMADLAREAADDLRIMREGRQVDLTIGDLPSCQGDRRFLKLVWINLLTNAFKYTKNRKETRIEVGWMPNDTSAESVIYYVKDNGIGFNMAYAHKLFGVFQRLHRREDFDGTGVGLAVVQRIVQRHDGRVWAEAKVDEGATFFVSLRRATA